LVLSLGYVLYLDSTGYSARVRWLAGMLLGALAVGAGAIGALAIGALAIRALIVKYGRIERLK
jgi:hypothetical protein